MAHRYWRIRTTRAYTTLINAMEIELRATPGGADQTPSVGGSAFASLSTGGTNPNSAFADDGSTSFWQATASTGVDSMNVSIGYDFGVGNSVDVVEFTWLLGTTAGRNPRDCILEYSDDNSNWYTQGTFTNVASGASNSTTVYNVAVPLDSNAISTKAGYHIAFYAHDNVSVTDFKVGTSLIISGVDEGDTALKTGTSLVLQPVDGSYISRAGAFLVSEREPGERVSGVTAYVVFRPIPPPPRKTIVIIGPGTNFGGTGQSAELKGTVEQEQEVRAKLSLPQRLVGAVEQDSLVRANLFVDNGAVDQFLEGTVTQTSVVSARMRVTHHMSGVAAQESLVGGDLFVDADHEDHFLEGTVTQTSPTFGRLTVAKRFSGIVVQESVVTAVFDDRVRLSGSSVQVSNVTGDLDYKLRLRGGVQQSSFTIAHLNITHNMAGSSVQFSDVTGDLTITDVPASFSLLSTTDELEEPSRLLLSGEVGREILSGV